MHQNHYKFGIGVLLEKAPDQEVFLIQDRTTGLKGRKCSIYSVRPEKGNRYASVWCNKSGEVVCSFHKTKGCEHTHKVKDVLGLSDDEDFSEQASEFEEIVVASKLDSVYAIPKQSFCQIPIPFSLLNQEDYVRGIN